MPKLMLVEVGSTAATRLSAEISAKQKAAVTKRAEQRGVSEQLMLREAIQSYCDLHAEAPFDGKLPVTVDKEDRCNISVRLPKGLATRFATRCRKQGAKKSVVIRWIVGEIIAGRFDAAGAQESIGGTP